MTTEVLGFNIWTKNMPQSYLGLYAKVAQDRQLPLVAVVDDVLPAVLFGRSEVETAEYNEVYSESMISIGFDRVDFVSEILPQRTEDLTQLYLVSKRVSLPTFLALLPERKRDEVVNLKLTEVVDTCWQLSALEAGMSKSGITRYLTGKRSTALFRCAKKIIANFEFDIIDN